MVTNRSFLLSIHFPPEEPLIECLVCFDKFPLNDIIYCNNTCDNLENRPWFSLFIYQAKNGLKQRNLVLHKGEHASLSQSHI
ncbi:unnamed protein product [Meloidogyne enterolobii]|uniref:Uncharacterized protein n=1 Tax=Meloidogyne enterolobii TaxID=390850 RepID=A0ACB0XM02_MELEN